MHDTLVEFLDKGRSGMASTFLTRLRVDDKIVDAKGVSRLYQSRVSAAAVIPLVIAAAITVVVALTVLPAGQVFFRVPRHAAAELLVLADWTVLVIDFRYHLVSIVAVFLALAIGIVVGATALQGHVGLGAGQRVKMRAAADRLAAGQDQGASRTRSPATRSSPRRQRRCC